jgi:ABC-2 type transport system permease protein
MTLWRLEWLRLTRTRRLVALLGVYVLFGFVGPLSARYLPEIIDRFGGDITVVVPEPVPADGISQYVSNASQIALLVAVAVVAGATTLHALPQMAVFLRTRVQSGMRLVLPRAAVTGAAVVSAYALGALIAWYETVVLLGALPVGGMLAGIAFGIVYLTFAVAVTSAAGAMLGSVLATTGASVLVLIVMPLVALVEPIGSFLPSHLVGAIVDLARQGAPTEYLPAATISLAASALLMVLAVRRAGSRQL